SAVKEVTPLRAMAVAPATLAGRGVIELIGADAGKLRRWQELFCLGSPGEISPRGGLVAALGQSSFPILPIVLRQRRSEICEINIPGHSATFSGGGMRKRLVCGADPSRSLPCGMSNCTQV